MCLQGKMFMELRKETSPNSSWRVDTAKAGVFIHQMQ